MEIRLHVAADQREADIQPEIVLPSQLGDRPFGTARLQPEKRLQLAVLQDAILTFHRLAGNERHRARRLFAEVESWFASDDASSPFAFVTICDTLSFDPSYIRGGLVPARAGVDGKRKPLFRRDGTGTRHQVVPPPLRRSA